ncbi:MAG: amidohydrolase [Myxococcales bacterium]
MAWDVVIRGGTVVDGSGGEPFAADVALSGDRIAAVGVVPEQGRREIDARGALVTPGFVDLHTHYDGQVSWDPDLMPSSVHGVTTAVMGSCGVGFAPVRPPDRERLIALMEGVEDIPGTALSEGIDWRWESFPEYLDALERQPRTIDVAAQVTHDPLRVFVMGERAVHDQPATPEDIAAMRGLLRGALDAGAIGFSTGRTDNHRSNTGAHTPAANARREELAGLGAAFRGAGHGVLQAVSDFDMLSGPDGFDGEFDLLEAMAEAAGRPLSISLMQRDQEPGQWRRVLRRVEDANARGLDLRVQVAPRAIGVMLGLDATFHPFMGFPSYRAIAALPLGERVARLREPAFKERLLAEKHERLAGDGSAIPPLADLLLAQLEQLAFRMFVLGAEPDYEPPVTASIGARARGAGVPVLAALYDALLEDDGHALVYFPIHNYCGMNLEAVREMLVHPAALPGLSDGGAHVATICDASFPTFLLQHWGRDRPSGRLSVERVVQMQSADTAGFLGLQDRGRLVPGLRADVNVIDLGRLRLRPPRLVRDLPAGGKRLLQRAEGVVATLVAGRVIVEGGALTGERPGRLVRSRPREITVG